MKKILVNIFVPILGVGYDIFIPGDSKMSGVAELLKRPLRSFQTVNLLNRRQHQFVCAALAKY